MQSSPGPHEASLVQLVSGTQRRRIALQISPIAQSVASRHPVATQRASEQRAPVPQSSSMTHSPVNTHRAASHSKPVEHSASEVHSPVNTHTPLMHSNPASVHGVEAEHSGVSTQEPSTQSCMGPHSLRLTHSVGVVHVPPTH